MLHNTNIVFVELLSVDAPQTYEKEAWQMNESEKIKALPKLREDGNQRYQKKQFSEASKLYAQAIGIIEQLQLKYGYHFSTQNKL